MTPLVWSYTSLSTFEQCPKKFHWKYILGNKEPETEAIRWGNYTHKSIENFLKGDALLPEDIPGQKLVKSVAESMKDPNSGFVELKMGVTEKIKLTSFFSDKVWGRGAADAVIEFPDDTLWCGDWKTGKRREKEDQLKMLGLFLLKKFPKAKVIRACNLWLQSEEIGDVYTFGREDEEKMWVELLKRLHKMYSAMGTANVEIMKPSGLCAYCPVKECRFNKS